MPEGVRGRRTALRSLLALALAPALARAGEGADYKPVMGQPGKDVVWVPSPSATVDMMLDLAKVSPDDFVIDLGSGDGRNVIAAAQRGARARGVEYNPKLVALSRENAQRAGVAERASFVEGDMFAADLSEATALVLFLIPSNLEKLAPKFVTLRPGTRIVSNTYEIGGGWEPDETRGIDMCATWCRAHLYVVPAQVQGTWQLDDGGGADGVLFLQQHFQQVYGTLRYAGIDLPIEEGVLNGTSIRFSANGVVYAGEIRDDAIFGTAQGRIARSWRAQRTNT